MGTENREIEARDDTPLYHVGCGRYLFKRGQAHMMALACSCGAGSPIVVESLNQMEAIAPCLPSSLFRVLKAEPNKPHLEYYLGFADWTCPAKQAWEKRLREEYGLVSFSECERERCQKEPERFRARQERFRKSAEVQP